MSNCLLFSKIDKAMSLHSPNNCYNGHTEQNVAIYIFHKVISNIIYLNILESLETSPNFEALYDLWC